MFLSSIFATWRKQSMAIAVCLLLGSVVSAAPLINITTPAEGASVTPSQNVPFTVQVTNSVAGMRYVEITTLDGFIIRDPGTGDFPASPPTTSRTINDSVVIPPAQAAGSAQLISVKVVDYVDPDVTATRNVNVQAGGGGGGSSTVPLIDLNASTLTLGSMTTWANHGSLGGAFNSITEFMFTGNPVVEMVDGRKAATFNSNGMRATVSPPASITGANPNFTVVFQSYNPNFTDGVSADGVEVSFEWGTRVASQWAGFGIGYNSWGAASFFGGGRDIVYGPLTGGIAALAPQPGAWHVSVITVNGTTAQATVYVDKIQTNQVTVGGTPPFGIVGIPFIMGGTSDAGTNRNVTGSFARVQVYNAVLDATQVATLTDALNAPTGPPPPNAVDDWMLYN